MNRRIDLGRRPTVTISAGRRARWRSSVRGAVSTAATVLGIAGLAAGILAGPASASVRPTAPSAFKKLRRRFDIRRPTNKM